jgi:hypothetical protein
MRIVILGTAITYESHLCTSRSHNFSGRLRLLTLVTVVLNINNLIYQLQNASRINLDRLHIRGAVTA